MKKVFYRLLSVCFVLGIFSNLSLTAQNNEVSINGEIAGNKYTEASVLKYSGKEMTPVAKATFSAEGTFQLKITVPTTDFYRIQFSPSEFLTLILSPGEKIVLKSNAENLVKHLVIKGSKESENIYAIQKTTDKYKSKTDSISKLVTQFYQSAMLDTSLIHTYENNLSQFAAQEDAQLRGFMKKNKGSLANLFLPDALPIDDNIADYMAMDSVLFAKYPNNYFVLNQHKQIIASLQTAIGKPAPDFTLPDTSNQNFSLSSLKGKMVLIDFWASWCNPCMGEMPNLIKLYNDFHPKGLEILGVSLDKDRKGWVNAIKNKKLKWMHVSDLKFWQSEVVSLYNFSGIPFTVLVDANGNIIAKNLRGEALYNKVASLLK